MRVEKKIAAGWAEQLRAECAQHAIAKFKGMRDCMLSGDSGLRNIWEEICAQVQGEESYDWDAYVELIQNSILGKVEQLPRSAQLALWVQTEEGSDWLEDHFSDDDGDDDAPLDVESITQLVKGSVLSAAADYESPTLYRFLWDADDPQYDEDEDEDEDEEDDGELLEASLRDNTDPLSDCPSRVVIGVAASNAEQPDIPNSYEARLARAKVRQAELSVPHLPVVSPLQFPGRFKLWQEHDLAKYRLDMYNDLSAADQQTAWEFIERNYLLKYPRLYRIEFEWGASGIWGIPFPGSVSLQGCYDPDDIKLPPDLAARLRAWHDNIDYNYDPSVKVDTFDWDESGREGLAVAKLIKAHIGPYVYLEYNSFRELKIVGDTVVELDVPDIANILPLSEGANTAPTIIRPRTAKKSAASAAKNAGSALTNAIDGLGALFGQTPNDDGTVNLNSGVPVKFNAETYAKAKPLFQAALADMGEAGKYLKEAMRAVIRMVLDKFGAQAAENMKRDDPSVAFAISDA